MSHITIDGYKVTQHDDSKEVLIFKDNRIVLRAQANKVLKEAELIDVFTFYKEQTNELEALNDDEKNARGC